MNKCSQKLIFVHIPKAAGTSLKQSIVSRVGEDSVTFKYDRPMSDGPLTRRGKCLIASLSGQQPERAITFGHFLAGYFARFTMLGFEKRPELRYVTFLREPLQRAISHYYFWKRTYIGGHKVWDRFTKEDWSLERFLLSKEHANFQSQFLWNFPIKSFDFVGLAERYEESVAMLGMAFPVLEGLAIRVENSNPEKSGDNGYQIDSTLAEHFKQLNADDYALYEEAVEIFERQKQKFGMKRNSDE